MYPEISLTQDITIGSYRLFGLLAAGYMSVLVFYIFNKLKVDKVKIFFLSMISIILFFVGSRLLFSILYFSMVKESPEMLYTLRLTGFSLHGGLILSGLFFFYISRKMKIDFFQITDRIVPHVGIAIVIMRVGCFLNGCCFGKPTSLPWGISVPFLSQAHSAQVDPSNIFSIMSISHVHPTQIYEMLAALTAALISWHIFKNTDIKGITTLAFCFVFSLGRLITFFYRNFPVASDISNFIRGPAVYGVVMVGSMIGVYVLYKEK